RRHAHYPPGRGGWTGRSRELVPAEPPRAPSKYGDYRQREHGGRHTSGLVPDPDASSGRDQEQQSSDDRRRQPGGEEQGKAPDYDLTVTAPGPAVDRPERQLCRNEERGRHERSTFVDRAGPQAQEDGEARADSHETPGK